MTDDAPDASSDDAALFRLAMQGVRLQPPSPRVSARADAPAPVPQPRQRQADELEALRSLLDAEPDEIESGDTLLYRAPGVQDAVMRRLRRGHYRIEAELDLHGLNRDRAKLAVAQFLARCHHRDQRCVRIIHGKGNGSPNSGPVIKALLGSWLRRRKDVLAYCSARAVDGGTGAVYVLVRAL
ncbi:Smr/MutS family protein [Solimonas flava]|uniref:Smr/MutS family protein n=1 Tax=Solimonas flava TaxID=415849 RepID=UPI000415F07F|nr:Smr/MutS family protein [Solimonas flava]